MLTYDLVKSPGVPLYEALYRCIRGDILSGKLRPGEKLPSKRALAANLEISKITVETAYSQLLSEGYISAREKVGYFVEAVERLPQAAPESQLVPQSETFSGVDLTAGSPVRFPFSVWSKLQREVMLDYGEELLKPLPNLGCYGLRRAIAHHLAGFRGMTVAPENILIGAGTDFLYNLLIQLLGRDKCYAVEDPGYEKIRKIYAAGGATCVNAPMDQQGVLPPDHGDILHISPNHHFPTGLVTPMARRRELLQWVNARKGWIIEDDYDSEFRFDAHPMPTMYSMGNRVIYMNTFSKSLAPSIRISYMVLPPMLMAKFQRELGFYSCTVPSFEQYTLERFLSEGYFEKHINRMRKFHKNRRNRLVELLNSLPVSDKFEILEQDAGLHFLLRVDTHLSDEALIAQFEAAGIRIHSLSRYYHGGVPPQDRHCLVVNYDGITDEQFTELEHRLSLLSFSP